MKLQLVVVAGPFEVGRVLKPPLSIGRADTNDLVLHKGTVAREHCQVWFEGEHLVVEDLGSSNGTWVNGKRIVHRHQLAAGDLDVDLIVKQVTAARLPVLRRLRLGPFPREGHVPPVAARWEACLAAHPRLDRSDPIWREERALIGTTHLDPAMNTVVAPDVVVTREHDAWWLLDRMRRQQRLDGDHHVPLVNGRRAVRHRLRPGDEIEAEPGVKLRFSYIHE